MYRLTVNDIKNILNLYTDEYVQKLKEEVDKIPKEDRTIELVPVSKKTIKTMLRYNKNLRKVTLPRNLEVIDDFAFSECTKLESIVIPKNVHTIGMRAFDKCYALKTIVFEGNIPIKISKSAFSNVPIHPLEIYSAADDMSIHVPNRYAGIIEPKPISEYYNRKESKENE